MTFALEPSITECRDSGHNTIFASLALKALHAAPQYALPAIFADCITDVNKRRSFLESAAYLF